MADEPMGDHLSRPSPDPTVLTTEAVISAVRQAKDYTDGRIAVLVERLRGIDTATEVLNATVTQVPTDVQLEVSHLKELVEEKFAGYMAVLDEQRRAKMVEEQEREKAAAALRMELSRAIAEGDNNLRDHIAAQVSQIDAALASAELLEVHRIDALEKQAGLVADASDAAISKAERSNEKQFDEFSKTVEAQITALRDTMQDLIRRLDKLA